MFTFYYINFLCIIKIYHQKEFNRYKCKHLQDQLLVLFLSPNTVITFFRTQYFIASLEEEDLYTRVNVNKLYQMHMQRYCNEPLVTYEQLGCCTHRDRRYSAIYTSIRGTFIKMGPRQQLLAVGVLQPPQVKACPAVRTTLGSLSVIVLSGRHPHNRFLYSLPPFIIRFIL